MQIPRSTPATLELLVYSSGDLADLDDLPSLAVTDANGDAIPGVGAVTTSGTGTYRATLPGLADLTLPKAVWSGDLTAKPVEFTRHYEIVGNLLFLEAEARAEVVTGGQAPLTDPTAYPDSDIARIRTKITDQFEHRTGRAWTRRYARCVLPGTGHQVLNLSEGRFRTHDGSQAGHDGRYRHTAKIISASIGGVAVDVDDLVLDGRKIHHTAGVWTRPSAADPLNVVVEYEYGPDPVPLEANDNGLLMALENVPSDVSPHAQTFASPDGTITFNQTHTYPKQVWEWLQKHKPVLVA